MSARGLLQSGAIHSVLSRQLLSSTQSRSFALRPSPKYLEQPQVLIQGCTIPGMSLALELNRNGIPCEILDGAKPTDLEKSDAMLLQTNSLSILEKMGILGEVQEKGKSIPKLMIYNDEGKNIQSVDFAQIEAAQYLPLGIVKSDLSEILKRAITKAKIPVYKNRITSIQQDDVRFNKATLLRTDSNGFKRNLRRDVDKKGALVHFRDFRNPLYFDVIVGADPNQLNAFRRYFTEDDNIQKAKEEFSHWNIVFDAKKFNTNALIECWCSESRILIQPLSDTKMFANVSIKQQEALSSFKPGKREIGTLLAHLENVGKSYPIADLTAALKGEEFCQARYPIQRIKTSLVNKRAVLLGDAGYYIAPYYGQEDALGIEDAHVLAHRLVNRPEGSVDGALMRYDAERRERVTHFMRRSRKDQDLAQKPLTSKFQRGIVERLISVRATSKKVAEKFEDINKFEF